MCEGFPFALSLGSVRKEGPLSQVSAAMHTTHFVPILSMRLTSPYHMFYSILLCTHYSLLPLSIMMGEKSPSLGRHRKGAKYKRISKKEKIYIFKVKLAPSPQRAALILIHQWKSKLLFFCPFNVVILLISNRVFVVCFWHILQIEKIFQKVLYFGPSRCLPSEGVLQRDISPPPTWTLKTSYSFIWYILLDRSREDSTLWPPALWGTKRGSP